MGVSNGLNSIAMEFLYEGMVVGEDIYNHNGQLLILAKGIVLTESKIAQLKNFNQNSRNISVPDMTYKELMTRGILMPSSLAQEYIEKEVGYSKAKEQAEVLLLDIASTDSISKTDTDVIAEDMGRRLATVDPSLVFQCINAPKPIDEYLRRHCINVGLINGLIGKWLALGKEEIDLLVVAGLVHDVGKTKIPAEILDAPRKLSLSEFEVMKMHPIYSYELLSKDERFSNSVKLAARHHHEKMNGSGYPDRINAGKISLFAKITAVSDIYDAMVSKRSYKEAKNPFTIISRLANKQFSELDMTLVRAFVKHMPAELVGKSVLLSDGSIGIIKFIVPSDLEHPIVEVNGIIKKTDDDLYCKSMVFE